MRQLKYVAIALAAAIYGCSGQGINTAELFKVQSGAIDLTVETPDPTLYRSVEFELDGNVLGKDEDGSDGWSYKLDSTMVSNGIHTVRAFGNTLEGARVELLNNTVKIQNEGTATPTPTPSPSASPSEEPTSDEQGSEETLPAGEPDDGLDSSDTDTEDLPSALRTQQ